MSESETSPAAGGLSKKVLAVIAAATAILVALAGLKAAWVQLVETKPQLPVAEIKAVSVGDPSSVPAQAPVDTQAQGMTCPKPLDQAQADVAARARGRLAAAGLMEGAINISEVKTTTRNLFAEYPNADRVAVAQAVLSATCELIKSSKLSDQAKMDMLLRTNQQVTSLVE